jgi:hypothetical protein
MKIKSSFATLLFTSFGFFGSLSAHATIINGYVIVEKNNHYLVDGSSPNTYEVIASNPKVQNVLNKLSTFDRIRGQVNTISENNLILETIDFVTLRKILGVWYDASTKTTLHFRDYQTLEWTRASRQSEMSYTLAPGAGANWKLFLSDSAKLTLGNLTIVDEDFSPAKPNQETHLILEILNTSTGEIVETLTLKRR